MCPFVLLDLHLLESRLREEERLLIKTKCVLINTQVQVKICRRRSSPILVYGGATCESSPSEAQSRNVVRLEEMKIASSTSSGLCARQRYVLDRISILPVS